MRVPFFFWINLLFFTIFAFMNQSQQIYLAPIQGLFNYHFRKVLTRHVKGFDKYFTPFVRTNGLDNYDPRDLREVTESVGCPVKTIPQVMGNRPELLIPLCERIQDMGFQEINLNMGCPYPMVTKKGMGAGILPDPEKIDSLLEAVFSKMDITFSVKMRLGMEDKSEIEKIIPVLNSYPLHEVIVHPRLGKQMYNGEADLEAFSECLAQIKAPLVYNGDILTEEDYKEKKRRFEAVDTWMIGRGIAVNPFLAENITLQKEFDKSRFATFHQDLIAEYAVSYTGGEMQIVLKMIEHWFYFIRNFPGNEKQYKAIRKCKKLDKLQLVCREIIGV